MKILLVNGYQKHDFCKGELNFSLYNIMLDKLRHNHDVQLSSVENYNVIDERNKFLWADLIIFQFPIYWFNCPPLMKKWLDEVFTDGWAYGKNGNNLENRNIGLAVTAGISENNYSKSGKYKHSLKEILLPFEITFNYCSANYKGFNAFYSAEFEATDKRIKESILQYINFLNSI